MKKNPYKKICGYELWWQKHDQKMWDKIQSLSDTEIDAKFYDKIRDHLDDYELGRYGEMIIETYFKRHGQPFQYSEACTIEFLQDMGYCDENGKVDKIRSAIKFAEDNPMRYTNENGTFQFQEYRDFIPVADQFSKLIHCVEDIKSANYKTYAHRYVCGKPQSFGFDKKAGGLRQ